VKLYRKAQVARSWCLQPTASVNLRSAKRHVSELQRGFLPMESRNDCGTVIPALWEIPCQSDPAEPGLNCWILVTQVIDAHLRQELEQFLLAHLAQVRWM
jgi:hypothetical protein